MNYNIIDEPWVHVEYLDGKRDVLSVRDVLKNSLKIKKLTTPMFSGTYFYLYEYCALEFLTNLVLAAYYKPEQDFAPKRSSWKEPLKKDGLYSPVVESYLKKYHDRFNLFDNERPFLQDASMRPEKFDRDSKYLAMTNPVSPAENTPIFGQYASRGVTGDVLSGYAISIPEFPYLALYHGSIANNPNGTNYYGTLRGNAMIFAVPIGGSLCETILKNCYCLAKNDRPNDDCPDALFDRPIWELDNIADAFEYPPETLYKNTLLCAYYPGKLFIAEPGDNGYISSVYMPRKTLIDERYPQKKEIIESLSLKFPMNDPNAIHKFNEEKEKDKDKSKNKKNKSKENISSYYSYLTRNDFRSWTILIDATGKVSDNFSCPILGEQNEKCTATIYFRRFDKNKANLLMSAVFDLPQSVDVSSLVKDNNRQKMIQIQKFYSDMYDRYCETLRKVCPNESTRMILTKSYGEETERYMFEQYIPNINDDGIYLDGCQFIVEYVVKKLEELMRKTFGCDVITCIEEIDKIQKKN